MPRDNELPIAESFHGLVADAQSEDLKAEEVRLKVEKVFQRRLFEQQHPGKLTASQAFLPDERENEKLKSQITKELDEQEKIRRAAQEKQDAKPEGDFPPPVLLP